MIECSFKTRVLTFKKIALQRFHHNSLAEIHSEQSLALAIGMFDGVHLGHCEILKRTVLYAKENNLIPALWTFTSSNHKNIYKRIFSELDHLKFLENIGIQQVHHVEFTKEIKSLNAEPFLSEILIKKLNCKAVFIGENAKLGKERHCDAIQFLELSKKHQVDIEVIPALKINKKRVSSTQIRETLKEGNVDKLPSLLGKHWFLKGTVFKDQQKGQQIGFPTANILPDEDLLLPAFGVYECRVECPELNLENHIAIANLGKRPTIQSDNPCVLEVHLLDFRGDLYNQELTVYFHKFIRAEKQFKNLEALKDQIATDIQKIQP